MFSNEMARLLHEDREREIADHLRVRRLLGDRHLPVRWYRGYPARVRQAPQRPAR
ncbi:MAG TPA: hypothetical protein VF013_06470 [Candidatus Limnocylindria bacterium]